MARSRLLRRGPTWPIRPELAWEKMLVAVDYRIGASGNNASLIGERDETRKWRVDCGLSLGMVLLNVDDGPKRQSTGTLEQGSSSSVWSPLSHELLFDFTALDPSDDVFRFETLNVTSICGLVLCCLPCVGFSQRRVTPWQVHVRCTIK